MGCLVGGGGGLPVRSSAGAVGGFLHRHSAADRQWGFARRARVQLHADRLRGPLPADAGAGGVLPDGLGRQRPAHRAQGAELLRRALRPVGAPRRKLRTARRPRRARTHRPAELHRPVPATHRHRRAGVRGPVPAPRCVGGLGPHVHHHRRALPAGVTAGLPAQPGPRRGLPGRGPVPVGRHVPHRRGAGRTGGPPAPGSLPSSGLRPRRRQRGRTHRDHAAGDAGGLRGARGAPR